MMRRAQTRAVAFSVLLAVGCTPAPLTELLIVTDTDLPIPAELTGVRFEIEGPRGDWQYVTVDFAAGDARSAVLALVHRDGPLGPLTIDAVGLRGERQVVRRRARVHFVSGQVLALRIELRASCVGERCPEGETCADAGCRPIDVEPDELEPWISLDDDAGIADAGIDDAGGCDDGIACTMDRRIDGACVYEPDDGACDDGIECTVDACDGELGCVSEPSDGACADGVACTLDRCDAEQGCVNEPDDARCDDGVACTVDRCGARGCEHTVDHDLCEPGELCDRANGCLRGPGFGDVFAFFERRCLSCHDESGARGGLDLSEPIRAWSNLVGVPSRCDGSPLVIPGDAGASLLWRKLARVDLCGDRMPPSGPPTSGGDAAVIERWINAGAIPD